MKTINCLMLKTADRREFFTHQKHLPQLVEFARTCGAEISIVKAQDPRVLGLPELAKSICNHNQPNQSHVYEVLEIKMPRKSRQQILEEANTIQGYVKAKLSGREAISAADLQRHFGRLGLSRAAMSAHIGRARRDLVAAGYRITKVGRGKYQAQPPDDLAAVH